MSENEKNRVSTRLNQIDDLSNAIWQIVNNAGITETECVKTICNCITEVIEKINEEMEEVTEKE